jgi:hypothetical protein
MKENIETMYHYRAFVQNHIRNQSFSLQLSSAIEGDFDEMYHYRTFVGNHIINQSFSLQFCSTIESDFEDCVTIEHFMNITLEINHSH